jgi:hypothetical protein
MGGEVDQRPGKASGGAVSEAAEIMICLNMEPSIDMDFDGLIPGLLVG